MEAWALHFDQPLPYARGLAIQEAILALRIQDKIPDTFLFLEHRPVITLGRRGRSEHLLHPPDYYAAHGIDLVTASRGGDVTFHGPGQQVLYPILKLSPNEQGAHGYLDFLEEIAIQTAAHFGVNSFRREGMAGAWTDQGKIAAIGFKFKRWTSYHGMSFNVDLEVNGFDYIVGCGLVGTAVTQLKTLRPDDCPDMKTFRAVMQEKTEAVMQRKLTTFSAEGDLPDGLDKLRELVKEPYQLNPDGR